MVLQGNRKVWALGPGVALGLIDLCGAQYSPTGGQATHTVDLTLQENKTFPIFSNIFSPGARCRCGTLWPRSWTSESPNCGQFH